MISLRRGLPADLSITVNRSYRDGHVCPPADGFWHEDRLNLGPAILLAVSLSLFSWVTIIGTGVIVHPFF